MTAPSDNVSCWPIDLASCSEFYALDGTVQEMAEELATQTLRHLTAYRVGGCPITVRPCWDSVACCVTMAPVIVDGQWYNSHCVGPCDPVCTVPLPPPVNQLVSVQVDGVTVDPIMYRVDNSSELVWLGDGCGWPVGQDMNATVGEADTFAVTYTQGAPVDALASYMAGLLACEYGKALTGAKGCRLPAGVTSVSRQGVSYNLASATPGIAALFPGGLTGINEIDAWVRMWNPRGVTSPSVIWSPNQPVARVTSWQT